VFVEAHPRTTWDVFMALRHARADVWIGDDMRLGVRMHDGAKFAQVCELLATLDHEIESINLAYLPLDDLEPLVSLRIERLDLTGTHAPLRPLRHLVGLRELSLAQTDLDSLAPLVEIRGLERLDLSGARVELNAVGQLPALRRLDLRTARTAPRGFKVRDGDGLDLAGLRSSTTLEVLDLSHTKVRDWAALAALWTVRDLDLAYTNFAELGHLRRFDELERLSLRRTAVSDLLVLVKLEALRRVDVRDCELLDDAKVDQLVAARPDLEILR
jgi:Leucine-rich repeat (LRR) protein